MFSKDRERLYRAEFEFESLTAGARDLVKQDGDAATFSFCDGEQVKGWEAAADTAERHVRNIKRQLND